MQYHFLRGGVSPRNRFSRWAKDDITEKLKVIKEYYGYSNAKAKDIEHLIDEKEIEMMKTKLCKGGR